MRDGTAQIAENFAELDHCGRAEPVKGVSRSSSRPPGRSAGASDLVRYLAFLVPALGACALGPVAPLFRADQAVAAALGQGEAWSGGISTLVGRAALALPLGNLNFRLALPSMVFAGLLGLATFELAYALFRRQGGYSRLDPWLAWGASLAAALNLVAASEATTPGGATLAPALSIFMCASWIERSRRGGAYSSYVTGALWGALLCESAHCAVLVLIVAALLWPDVSRASENEPRPARGVRGYLEQQMWSRALRTSLSAATIIFIVAHQLSWFFGVIPTFSNASTNLNVAHVLSWPSAVGTLWCLSAVLAVIFSLRDRRPLYVMCLLAMADVLLPGSEPSGWINAVSSDVSRSGLHLFLLAYVTACGALGMRTFAEAAQAVGLLGARHFAVLISIVAVAGSLATAEDSLTVLSQTEVTGAEAWTEEALQALPPRALLITQSQVRGRRLRAAQLLGARPDVLVVPLSELSQARHVRRWLKQEPELHGLLVDLSLSDLPSERSLTRLIDTRPVFIEPSPSWDQRLLEHVVPGLPLSAMSTHALARSDRLAALDRVPAVIERIMTASEHGARSDRATLSLFKQDMEQLRLTLAPIDRVAASHVEELSPFVKPPDPDLLDKNQRASSLAALH